MAKREVRDCDKCGATAIRCAEIRVYDGSTYNGVDSDHSYKVFDLCLVCCGASLNDVFDKDNAFENVSTLRRLKLNDIGVRV